MSKKTSIIILILSLASIFVYFYFNKQNNEQTNNPFTISNAAPKIDEPLSIQVMRSKDYPGSELIIEETLEPGSNYARYIASYKSGGLKIYGLLTMPQSDKPKDGFPVVIFNHGYIPPAQYKTTERYVAYVDAFARNGYIVFKPDYRGNGNSEGQPEGAYYSPAYATDVLNALSSVKRLKSSTLNENLVNPQKIGMWGHSLGGNITIRSLVVRPEDIKAAVIWGGVVGTYDDLLNRWKRRVPFSPSSQELALRNRYRARLMEKYGTPKTNPVEWNALDPNYFLADIKAPVQLHAGEDDEEVPVEFSKELDRRLKSAGKTVELYTYPGDNHNISNNLNLALQRSVEFFDKYLK